MSSARFIVIGSGIAGLRAAISLAQIGRVVVLTKAEPSESNTGYAQGGIAAAIGDDDAPALHARDTIRAGDGLCDEEAVRVLVEDGPNHVRELIEWGACFDADRSGRPALGREAAHSVRRVLHAGDATGREIGRVLWQRANSLPAVEIVTPALVTELVTAGAVVTGVRYVDSRGARHEIGGDAVLLATGGAGQLFSETTNPAVATGDGLALAYDAGARVADLEFVQFHPTALKWPGAPRFLISEALRGEGARLVNHRGEAFMTRYHLDGDLAPRDVVARSIAREVERTAGAVYLTAVHLDGASVLEHFPTIAATCAKLGLDITRDPIPVGPAAHYMMGGVDTDIWGRTSLRGLYAAGEVACSGVHGANRLASNSLLEGLVFGARAARAMAAAPAAALLKGDRVSGIPSGPSAIRQPPTASHPRAAAAAGGRGLAVTMIQHLMWRSVGLFRARASLEEAVARLEHAADAGSDDQRQPRLLTVARLIARAALRREESRGGHCREDFPERDDIHWKVHLVDCLDC